MKQLIVLMAFFLFAACTSVEKLKSDQACQVWEVQPVVGPNALAVSGNRAQWKGSCALYPFLCRRLIGELDDDTHEITLSGSGLFKSPKTVAALKDIQVEYVKTAFDNLVTTSPIQIDMEKLEATRTVKNKAFIEMVDEQRLHFNKSCKPSQVAVGAVTLWASKNNK